MHRIGLISVFLLITFYHAKAAVITSTTAGGPWTLGTTWTGGSVPGGSDDVVISTGSAVTLNNNTVSSGIKSLTIQTGGSITLTGPDNIRLNVKSDIVNNGILNLWLNETQGAALYILGGSTWSGTGTWNMAQISIGDNAVEFAADLTLTINRKIDVNTGTGSLNLLNKRPGITFIFGGTENATIPSQGDRVFYGNIDVRKMVNNVKVSFTETGNATTYNTLSVLGDIVINSPLNIITGLGVADYNVLDVRKNVSGNGRLIGGTRSDIVINGTGTAPHINAGAGVFRNVTVNRPAGVVLDSSIAVLQTLSLNNNCRLILPSGNNFNLTIGSTSTAGTVTGNGFLVQPAWTLVKELADITIKGNAPAVDLRFSQTGTENIIHDLIIDKTVGVVNLLDGGTLQVRNTFTFTKGIFSIGSGTLKLTGTISFGATGFLRGSTNSTLFIGNDVASAAATLYFDQSDASAQSLKSYRQLRNGTVTLGNNLNIVESVDLSGGAASNVFNSNGKLTLLSTSSQTAYIGNLGLSSISGNVNVQRYVSGGSTAYRGYRLASSPVATGTGVYNFQYLKNGTILSGAAGGGFDKDGNPTIYLYREDVKPGNASFTSGNFKGVSKINNTDLNDTGTQKHGTFSNTADTTVKVPVGNGALFFFRGDRFNNITNKTQAPFAPAEPVVFSATGTLNQKNIAVRIWYKNNNLLGFTDYSTVNTTVRGYNLVGNPYASTIDWNTNSANGGNGILFSSNADVDQKISYLNNTNPNQNYLWYDAASGLSSDPKASRYIASGQGFFIRAKTASATLTFTENAKSTQQPPTLLMGLPINEQVKTGFYIKLQQDSTIHDYCSIYFDKNWSDDFTDEDAPDTDGASPQVFLSTISHDGKRLAINKSAEISLVKYIPLYVDAQKTGRYTLSLEQIKSLKNPAYSIWLKDLTSSDSSEVDEGKSHSFFIDKTKAETFGDGRFVLVIQKQKTQTINRFLLAENFLKPLKALSVYPNPSSNFIRLNQYDTAKFLRASIISSAGKPVLNIQNPLYLSEGGVDIRPLNPGMYYLQLWTTASKLQVIPFVKL